VFLCLFVRLFVVVAAVVVIVLLFIVAVAVVVVAAAAVVVVVVLLLPDFQARDCFFSPTHTRTTPTTSCPTLGVLIGRMMWILLLSTHANRPFSACCGTNHPFILFMTTKKRKKVSQAHYISCHTYSNVEDEQVCDPRQCC
jgi:hypothetical protein